jgi:hypothetical protein
MSRLLEEEEASEESFDEDEDEAAELDIESLEESGYLGDSTNEDD